MCEAISLTLGLSCWKRCELSQYAIDKSDGRVLDAAAEYDMRNAVFEDSERLKDIWERACSRATVNGPMPLAMIFVQE